MASDSRIALESTSDMVVDFFETSIHSILYQRGVYPPEDFKQTKRFGVSILMSINPELNAYLDEIVQQLKAWLKTNHINKLVLVIKSKETNETLERWQFDVKVVKNNHRLSKTSSGDNSVNAAKEIRGIMRQIVASVSFLPILDDDDCTFNILVYASEDAEVPLTWADTDANLIRGGGEHVRLQSLSTDDHNIDTVVSYRIEDPF
ncbi:mitotic spindle assembly checkpoint protein MAD2 [Absidia repens]|uniref:Mitotic spindle assembly checkpoint protein MAD2 n=1 Tax=Absidia repens TaxID=90262 RepID=A0A1X2I7N7_9FUNG|nr:mitotic spindle assembly checkpoint protein MAD2 [Absidia repens]